MAPQRIGIRVKRLHSTLTADQGSMAPSRGPLSRILRSTSVSPHFNLSVEHHLLNNPPSIEPSLFIYKNRPSLVIGRNQNPFTELNLPHLSKIPESERPIVVRRRSGGGTVYHDLGNLNYCAYCPSENFNRGWAAEIVAQAIRDLGVDVKVNERYDIYLGDAKVSGSAFKVIRKRAYAHGTLLLNAELGNVGQMLKGVATSWINTKGVGSVRSKITNIGLSEENVVNAIVERWKKQYGGELATVDEDGEEWDGMKELQSAHWCLEQTPRFDFRIPYGTIALVFEVVKGRLTNGWIEPLSEEELKAFKASYGSDDNLNMWEQEEADERMTRIVQNLSGEFFDGEVLSRALYEAGFEWQAFWVEHTVLGRSIKQIFGLDQ